MNINKKNTAEDLSDEDLVEKVVLSGDTKAFGELYDRYAQLVYSKCRSFVSSSDVAEAEDLTQNIFVNVFMKLKSFKGNSKFSTWLYSFTYNHCINYYNREVKKKRTEVEIGPDYELEGGLIDEVSDEEIFSIAADKLKICIQSINPEEKVVLLMKYQDDVSIKEMAKILEIGESAVKMKLHRAKKKIVEIYNSL